MIIKRIIADPSIFLVIKSRKSKWVGLHGQNPNKRRFSCCVSPGRTIYEAGPLEMERGKGFLEYVPVSMVYRNFHNLFPVR